MILIMLGAPGTGKGTVAEILSRRLNIPQISSGDIFRKAIAEKTPLGVEVEGYLANGQLVPDELTIRVIEERLGQSDVENGYILDGFPRTEEQAKELSKFLKESGKEVKAAINLTTPEEEIIERISNRRVCSNQECKAVFNLKLNPPTEESVCDKCGGQLIQRKDDNVDTIKNRLDVYYKTAEQVRSFYENEGKLKEFVVSEKTKLAADIVEDIMEILK